MKIAVSSYSYAQAIRDGRMTIMDVIPKAADMGFEGIEIANLGETPEEMRAMAKELCQQSRAYGIPIVAYLTGADFLARPVAHEVDRLHREVEVCALLGAPRMRHDAARGVDENGAAVPFEKALDRLADGYRQVTEYAAGLGVHTMIENHGFFAQDSARVKALIERVDHKNFGWLVDMGNFLCADECPNSAVAVAAPYAVHAHAKDFHFREAGRIVPRTGWFATRGGNMLRGAIVGHGMVDVPGCLKLLKDAGYDNWVSIEFEGIEDCLMALDEGLYNLKASM